MDTQAVQSAGNPVSPTPKPQASAKSSGAKSSTSTPKPSDDSVSLSEQAQDLAQTSTGGGSATNIEQKKFSVTDSNDVVLKIIDPETQKVVKSIPSEEQIQLKRAIRDGIREITE